MAEPLVGRVDEETLRQVLAVGGETAALDFKSELHLDKRRDVVAVAKDIGAMAAVGGHIVVGADERGRPTGKVTERDCELFDEARLRAKVERYVGRRTTVHTAWHVVDGQCVAVIAVLPHPLGVCVFAVDGNYDGGQEFRAGDVFVRRGTASVRWSEDEAQGFLDRIAARQREAVRAEVRADLEAAVHAATTAATLRSGPSTALSWELDVEAFVSTVIEQVREGDEVPLRTLLVGMPRVLAEYARATRGIDRTADLLDRAVALLAQFITLGRSDLAEAVVRRLVSAYERAVGERSPATAVPAPVLGLMQAERATAVGALAVRERDWDQVRRLATVPLRAGRGSLPFWLLGAQRFAERTDTVSRYAPDRPRQTAVLSLAQDAVARVPHLAPDLLPDDQLLVTSLCEFDLLHALAVMNATGRVSERLVPGNFAGWYSERTDPLVVELLDEDAAPRQAVYPRANEDLAEALFAVEHAVARGWGAYGSPWDGYEDERIVSFLREYRR